MCKTNPIQRGVSSLRFQVSSRRSRFAASGIPHHSTIPSFQRSSPMPIVRNEPNSRTGKAMAGANHAKQTQFHRSAGALEGEMCKTNPISGEAGRWVRPIVPNEPNLPGLIAPNKANLPPAGKLGHRRSRSCETKPISKGVSRNQENVRGDVEVNLCLARIKKNGAKKIAKMHRWGGLANRPSRAPNAVFSKTRLQEFCPKCI